MKVPFAVPDLSNQEIQEVISVIKSGWLTTASKCTQFETDEVLEGMMTLVGRFKGNIRKDVIFKGIKWG